jgi:hypothetical protein
MKIATLLTLAVGFVLAGTTLGAQPPATATELPAMILKVCLTLERARSQADLSFEFAQVPQPARIEPRFIEDGCTSLPVVARLRSVETSITPFETWAVTYDPGSPRLVDARHAGVTYKVPVALRKQTVRYFAADLMVPVDAEDERIGPEDRGKWFGGWVEVPDSPYLSKYLEVRGQ